MRHIYFPGFPTFSFRTCLESVCVTVNASILQTAPRGLARALYVAVLLDVFLPLLSTYRLADMVIETYGTLYDFKKYGLTFMYVSYALGHFF